MPSSPPHETANVRIGLVVRGEEEGGGPVKVLMGISEIFTSRRIGL